MRGDQMIRIGSEAISLDRIESGSTADFISHAHSDHISAARRSKKPIMSEQTRQLLGAIGVRVIEEKSADDIELLPAGHILGSRQLYAYDQDSGISYLYSGDFQMQKSMAAEKIKTKHADVLIIDSTYPDPQVSFGYKEDIISSIEDWVAESLKKGSVLFSAYAMGKAQELIAIMNDVGIVPVVTKKIGAISKAYNECGMHLKYASAYEGDEYEELLKGDFVGISEQRNINELASKLAKVHKRSFYTAVVTGFASFMKFNTDAQFSLSDHADFAQSIDYINEVNPKLILTYGGNAKRFATNLGKLNYKAVSFCEMAMIVEKAAIQQRKTKEYIY